MRWIKSRLQKIIGNWRSITAFGLVIAVVLSIGGLLGYYFKPTESSSTLLSGFMTLAASFAGAFFAFLLNGVREIQKEDKTKKLALNRALFILGRQINTLMLWKRDLDKYPKNISRAISFPALYPGDYSGEKQSLDELGFLLHVSEPNTLFKLMLEQERFDQAIRSIVVRSDFHVKELQPAIEKGGLNGKAATEDEFKNILGERIFGTALNMVKEMDYHIKESLQSTQDIQAELHALAKKLYPNDIFIRTAE